MKLDYTTLERAFKAFEAEYPNWDARTAFYHGAQLAAFVLMEGTDQNRLELTRELKRVLLDEKPERQE